MAENIRFYFDPLCPWCYQTSRWARRLDELGVVDVEWRVFSLAIVNGGDEGRSAADTGSAPSLRTAVAVRDAHGNDAVGAFYKALSDARHLRGLPLDDHAVIEASPARGGRRAWPAAAGARRSIDVGGGAARARRGSRLAQGIWSADDRARRRRWAADVRADHQRHSRRRRARSISGRTSSGWRAIATSPR